MILHLKNKFPTLKNTPLHRKNKPERTQQMHSPWSWQRLSWWRGTCHRWYARRSHSDPPCCKHNQVIRVTSE